MELFSQLLLLPKVEFHESKARMAGRKENFPYLALHPVCISLSFLLITKLCVFLPFQGKLSKQAATWDLCLCPPCPLLPRQETCGQQSAAAWHSWLKPQVSVLSEWLLHVTNRANILASDVFKFYFHLL